MEKAASVIVIGHPGPIRDELLLRREIDVLWAGSFEDALTLSLRRRVEAIIVAPEFEAGGEFEEFRDSVRPVPCVLLAKVPIQRQPDKSAEHQEVESVLAFLANHTGLFFARYPRAPLEIEVSVEVLGEQYTLETVNISVTGAAVRGFPKSPPGTRAELVLELCDRPLYLVGRVVRNFQQGGENFAGLSFIDLSEPQRALLSRAVDETLAADRPGYYLDELLADLNLGGVRPRTLSEASDTQPTHEISYGTSEMTVDTFGAPINPVVPRIRSLNMQMETRSIDIPEWMHHMPADLTPVESAAAAGLDAPDWAHRVLRLRINLARARAANMEPTYPASLVDEAYQVFTALPETEEQEDQLREQISTIRASLLRDVLNFGPTNPNL